MPPEIPSPDAAHLWEMREHLFELEEMCRDRSRQDLDDDIVLRRAIERVIEIIGEAARRVSGATTDANPQILWRGIIAQRHVLAHEYGDIDLDKIWSIVTTHGPELRRQLDGLIPEPPPDPLPEADENRP